MFFKSALKCFFKFVISKKERESIEKILNCNEKVKQSIIYIKGTK